MKRRTIAIVLGLSLCGTACLHHRHHPHFLHGPPVPHVHGPHCGHVHVKGVWVKPPHHHGPHGKLKVKGK
jgi:hypothetical protein